MTTLNLGIVAHVDAGKTTLTERLLYETGVITTVGRVDHGDTTTDSDTLERQRGITIRSGVVAFRIGELKVNLLDTPGHSDFVAEVERALAVLDGAVLVVSAVEGVQAQTRVLIRVLEQLRIPFLVFVNKIDRMGARHRETLDELREAVSGAVVELTQPRCLGDRTAYVETPADDVLAGVLTEQIAEYDDDVLASYVDRGTPLALPEAVDHLTRLTAQGLVHPTFYGAALHGIGVTDAMAGIARYLRPVSAGDPGASLHAQVFRIENSRHAPRVAFVRVRNGTLAPRDTVTLHHRGANGRVLDHEGRPSAVRVLDQSRTTVDAPAPAGEIATVVGLPDVQIGDQIGRWDPSLGGQHFSQPGLEAVVRPVDPAQRSSLFEALTALSQQDPLIDARLAGIDDEVTVSLYGEVQKEVLSSRLADEFGIRTRFMPTRTIHVERVLGVGEAVEAVPTHNASVGLRIEPGDVDSGFTFRLGIERGWLLPAFHVAIEETLAAELAQGLAGWRVVDAMVTQIAGRFSAPTPPAGYYRELTSLAFRNALRQAGTTVCEPLSEFEVEFPSRVVSLLMRELTAAGATPAQSALGRERGRITGTIPTAAVYGVEQRLPHLTGGRGVLLTAPGGYRPVTGTPPHR